MNKKELLKKYFKNVKKEAKTLTDAQLIKKYNSSFFENKKPFAGSESLNHECVLQVMSYRKQEKLIYESEIKRRHIKDY